MDSNPANVARLARRLVPRRLNHLIELLEFFYVQRFKGFAISGEPSLDEVSLPFFLEALSNCTSYLEYGSGGSTLLAARSGKPFICVDSDPYFLQAVRRKIEQTIEATSRGEYLFCDIGLTAFWGKPVIRKPFGRAKKALWRHYPEAPWALLTCEGRPLPDLVLIDGRFRVACALTAFLHLQSRPGCRILVDDYRGRSHYREIERFGTLESYQGRMGVFRPKVVDSAALREALSRFGLDWR